MLSKAALVELANAYPSSQIEKMAYGLYERFRPETPAGKAG